MSEATVTKSERPKVKRKKRKGPSPNKRTIDYLEARGALVAVVEQRIPGTWITRDMFGCFDLVAVDHQPGPLAIQVTSSKREYGTNAGFRMEKVAGTPAAVRWIQAGGRVEVWEWRVLDAKGIDVELRRFSATLEDGEIVWDDFEEGS